MCCDAREQRRSTIHSSKRDKTSSMCVETAHHKHAHSAPFLLKYVEFTRILQSGGNCMVMVRTAAGLQNRECRPVLPRICKFRCFFEIHGINGKDFAKVIDGAYRRRPAESSARGTTRPGSWARQRRSTSPQPCRSQMRAPSTTRVPPV